MLGLPVFMYAAVECFYRLYGTVNIAAVEATFDRGVFVSDLKLYQFAKNVSFSEEQKEAIFKERHALFF